MPSLFSWLKQTSKNNSSQASDDLSQLDNSTKTSSETSNTHQYTNELICENLKKLTIQDQFIDEITIHIAQYLPLKDLNHFAQVDSHTLKLIFNLENSNVGEMDYDRDEVVEFQRIQQLIWKPMVHYIFPKFSKNLNVKNWMHVLRRRMKHIKLHGKNFKIDTPSFVKTVEEQKYIDNCEFIYKCPLQFDQLSLLPSSQNVRLCRVCNKNVHMVHDMESFEKHMIQGDCIAFSPKLRSPLKMPQRTIAGGMRPPQWVSRTPSITPPSVVPVIPPTSNNVNNINMPSYK